MPGDVKALAVYADAFLYSSSAQGIVKQVSPPRVKNENGEGS